MKNFRIFSWVLMAVFTLSLLGCGGPIESFSFSSPDGDRTIDVSGKRESPAGPIIVSVVLKVPGGEKPFSFEHQASSMTKENVTAEWNGNNRCTLTFKMDDNTSWELNCFLLDDRVEAVKEFKLDGKSIFH